MKILILKFPYSSLFGGGEQHTIRLVEELSKRGYEFFLVSTCRVLLSEFRKRNWSCRRIVMPKEPVSKGTIVLFPFVAPYAMLRLIGVLVRYRIAGVRWVFCLSLLEKILIGPFARILGMRVIWMEHVEPDRWLSLNPFLWLLRRDSRRVRIVVISNIIKTKLEQLGFPEKSMRVIYNGIDIARFPLRSSQEKSGPRHSAWTIGTIGRLEAEKGVDVLLRAFAMLRDHQLQCKLVILGEGSQRKSLEWMAETLGVKSSVQFVGFQPDVEQWMKSFDLFVLPSVKRESFGMVLAEALATGVPVIASRLGGIPEIITDRAEGLLVAPGDASALFTAMMWSLQHAEQVGAMVERGRKKVEQSFSMVRQMDQFDQLFQEKA